MKNNYSKDSIRQIKNYVYNTHDQIGKGFSSIVYKGRKLDSNQLVAIKVIDTNTIKTDIQKMLLNNQIKALTQLKHENIIELYDICHTPNYIYIITEFCNNGDLATIIKNKGKYSEEEALKIFSQIVEGFSHIITNGIIHRDLKTTNILVKDNSVKIADFGFCEFLTQNSSQQFYNVGSPLYMSPQAYKKTQYSHKSDMWAIGIILYQMFLGQQPFRGIDYDTLLKQITSGEIYRNLNVSGFVKMLLSRLLSVDIQRRIQINELKSLLDSNKPKIISESPLLRQPSLIVKHDNPIANINKEFVRNSLNLNSNNVVFVTQKPKVNMEIQNFSSNQNHSMVNPIQNSIIQRLNTEKSQFKSPFVKPTEILQSKQKPFLISFQSNLSTTSNKIPEYTATSQYLLISKFLYRYSKIIFQIRNNFESIKRISFLVLKHLQNTVKYFERENLYYLAENNEQNTFKKMQTRMNDVLSRTNFNQMSHDMYFMHILHEIKNYNQQESVKYIQFWLKLVLKQLNEQIQKKIKIYSNFQAYEVQILYISYLFTLKYYESLQYLKGKHEGEQLPLHFQLQKLITEVPTMTMDGFLGLSHRAKFMVK